MKKDTKRLLNRRSTLKARANKLIDKCRTEIRGLTEEEAERLEEIKEDILAIEEELKAIEEEVGEPEEENKEEKSEEPQKPQKEEEEEEKSEEPQKEDEEEPQKEDECREDEEDEEEPQKEDEEEIKSKRNKNIKSNKMEKRFSLLTAIRNIANGRRQDDVTASVMNAGNAEMRKSGLNYVGQIQLPSEQRALTVADEGEDVVVTDFLDIVKPLQAKNVMIQAGAKYLTGLVGDVQYPVMKNGACTWEGETAEAKDGSPSFTNVKLSPKRLTTVVPVSKQFLVQDSIGAENAIREEIINAINNKLEATILGKGAGSATEPKGLLNGATETIADFSDVTEVEAKLEEANVYGGLKYILSPKAKAALRNMPKSDKVTQLVYENGEIDGTEALSTSHVKDNGFVYGDFSQYVVAQWGNLDITVDTVTLADKGQVRLVVNAYFDAKPLREEAFVAGTVGE